MFRRRSLSAVPSPRPVVAAVADASIPPDGSATRDTSETRRAAEADLFGGIGRATETNLALGTILRDAFALADEMAGFSGDFEASAEKMRACAADFAGSVGALQSQGGLIESRLATASREVERAHGRSRSALASVEELTRSIGEIERVVAMIAAVASQTNLLALNATIEAARAGAAGAGFRVVAGEVKSLSQQTQRATDEIKASVAAIRQRAAVNTSEVEGFDTAIRALEEVIATVGAAVASQGEQARVIGAGSADVAASAQTVRASAGRMRELGGTVKTMTAAAETAAERARHAFARLTDHAAIVLRNAENDEEGVERWPTLLRGTLRHGDAQWEVRVIAVSADGVQIGTDASLPSHLLGETVGLDVERLGRIAVRLLTPTQVGFEAVLVEASAVLRASVSAEMQRLRRVYAPYIARVQDVAQRIAARLEAALAAGEITGAALFGTSYERVGMAEPAEYTNASVAPLEAITRSLLEHELKVTPMPDFCILQDRNGFNPVHNLRYSQPRRVGEVAWSLRHSRMRRIFDDRVGLSASRNLRPFLVQSYARDMGDTVEWRMEFDAPLFVGGRHWGAVRMAYDLALQAGFEPAAAFVEESD